MKIKQLYTKCLAQGAYYIESKGVAAIIDPLREVQPYLDLLSNNNATLKYIFETHFHADFVSGHLDLHKKTNATIVYGPNATPEFEALIAKDEQIFEIGDLKIKALHTPGHTLESTTYLLIDEEGNDHAIFSGDTLFLGDVGRPDLAQKAASMTQEDLAGMLYDSLQTKIMPLHSDVIVYPAHGAGSACGKNMQKETVDTLGNQKRTNYALNQASKAAFIAAVTDGLEAPPAYFGYNVAMNKKGYNQFEEVLQKGMTPLSIEQWEQLVTPHTIILDTRSADDFARGFIPNAINIGIKGGFAPWVGAMLGDVKQPILLVADKGSEKEVITRLSRVGFDNVQGFLQGGFDTYKNSNKEFETVNRITPETFATEYTKECKIIDVRKVGEYTSEHIEDAYLRPLSQISEWTQLIDKNETFFLHCAGGYRSMIAASILKSQGIHNFKEIAGGYGKIKNLEGIPTTDFVCQSKTAL